MNVYAKTKHAISISPVYDPESPKEKMLMIGVSPSPLLDGLISLEYYNKTVDLGVTTQLYTARGSQS